MKTSQTYPRRGTAYVLVLTSALVVTTLGMGSLLAVRVQRRTASLGWDATHARQAAFSAVSLGRLYVEQDPNWRTTRSHGVWLANQSLGDATFSLSGEDPCDTSLSDNQEDLLVLTGIGFQGSVQHRLQVLLQPVIKPLEGLNTALHAEGNLSVKGGKNITVVAAPLSTNSQLDNDGTIDGDAESDTLADTGSITGTLTTGVAAKTNPSADLFTRYRDRATVIAMPGDIDKQVLTPGYNPWGTPNADGVYYINTQDGSIKITNSRIEGTLIIDVGSKTVTLDDSVFLKNARSDYPILIVKGNLEIRHHSPTEELSEVKEGTNFNPVGAPYAGDEDTDKTDVYPNEVQGLIHVIGDLVIKDSGRIRGAILCEGSVSCEGSNWIIHDPSLYTTPPDGYTYVSGMQVVPNSYQRIVN